jgi:nucleoside-diphosphate-sugar epimerase
LTGRKIAVTGAGGFIGSSIVRLLVERGACVRALLGAPGQSSHTPPDGVVSLRADILDAEVLLELVRGCDTVIHAAGPPSVAASFESPVEYARVHVTGTCAVAVACRKSEVGLLIYLSSAEVYGQPEADRVCESHPIRPRSPYGAAKAGAEHFVSAVSQSGACNCIILRPFSVYGPRMSSRSVMAAIVRQARLGGPVILKDLKPVRDYCYVTDLAAVVMAACMAPVKGLHILNAGTGHGISVGELADLILDELKLKLPVIESDEEKRPAGTDILRLIADPSRARALLGWSAGVSLRQGIQHVIRAEKW